MTQVSMDTPGAETDFRILMKTEYGTWFKREEDAEDETGNAV